MKTTFIGIGAQKCASTWLYKALGSHPKIGTSSKKELDFFSYCYDRGFEWYEGFNEGFEDRLAVGEISPSYFHVIEAPARARAYNPDMRIIVSLRDPIERAYSNHLHLIRLNFIKGEDKTFEHGIDNCPMYLHQSRYALHLARWLAEFPRASIHVVLQEDVARDPVGEMHRLFDFLGLDRETDRLPAGERFNRSAIPRHQGLDRSLKKLGRVARSLGLDWAVEGVKSSALVKGIRARNIVDLRQIVPPPRPETVLALKQEFADDVEFVRQLLGRDSLPWRHFS